MTRNAEGLAGLANRRAAGPTPRLSAERTAEVARWVEDGPDLARDGVVRWRCRDLGARIEREFGVSFHERSIGKLLDKLRFRRLSVRPQHPESDPARAGGVQGGFAERARTWAKPGSRPRAPRDRRYTWAWLFGAVCPSGASAPR